MSEIKRFSADLGHADLRKSNDSSQILDFRALVHAPTPHPSTAAGQTRTGARTVHAPVLRTRSGVQSSKRSGCSRAPVHRHLVLSAERGRAASTSMQRTQCQRAAFARPSAHASAPPLCTLSCHVDAHGVMWHMLTSPCSSPACRVRRSIKD